MSALLPVRLAVTTPVQPPAIQQPETILDVDLLRRLLPPYVVIVHNNDYNTFDEVIYILMKAVPGMTLERAVALTYEVHETGSAVPYRGPKETAEAVAEVIRTIGIKVTVAAEG